MLVSWAVPKNLPDTPSVNHLAVHTEDHPLEYLTFHGTIPKGEYGAGNMIVWDTGTYETEKFNDVPPDGPAKGGEVIVTLHGKKIDGRYALIQTDGKNWLAHRMKEQSRPQAGDLAPMLATEGSVDKAEGDAVGVRRQVGRLPRAGRRESRHAQPAVTTRPRRHRRVSAIRRRWQPISPTITSILDGEAVALDESGVPSFGEMQNRARSTRVEYWAFDILHLDGRSLLRAKYSDRRRLLEALAEGGGLIVPDLLPGDGPEAMEYARKQRWEGVIAKKRDSTYQPGPTVVVVDQGQDLEHPGSGDRRLAARQGRPHQRHRRADARHPRRRRPALRRAGRHRVHREGADQAQGHPQAAADRRITVQHKASRRRTPRA